MVDSVLAYIQSLNPNTLIGIAALSGMVFMFQGIITGLFGRVKKILNRIFFYTLEIHYSSETFHKFNRWFHSNIDNTKFMRNYKVQKFNGTERIIPGYGRTLFFIKKLPIIIVDREKVEKKNMYAETDIIQVRVFSIFRRGLLKLFKQIKEIELYENEKFIPHLFQLDDGHWSRTAPLRSVLEPSAKGAKTLIRDALNFMKKKPLFDERGLPFKRGYLLYGKPGTGKTSMVLYLANLLEYNVYIVDKPLSETLLSEITEGSILLIEDIDLSFMGSTKRNLGEDKKNKNKDTDMFTEAKDLLNSDILRKTLNMLDGVYSYNNSILICTTNDKGALDEALIRPGRIDFSVEIETLNPLEQLEFFNTFFKSSHVRIRETENITVAECSQVLLENIDNEEHASQLLGIEYNILRSGTTGSETDNDIVEHYKLGDYAKFHDTYGEGASRALEWDND